MGRDKKNEARVEHFTKLTRAMIETEAWRALSSSAQALYPILKLEWKGPRANNNGKVRLSTRQAAKLMGMNYKAAMRAFQDLQAKGFIFVTEPARLGLAGAAKSPAFEITELPLPSSATQQGRRLYLDWKPGHDFGVQRVSAPKPKKTIPRSQNGTNIVPIMGTKS